MDNSQPLADKQINLIVLLILILYPVVGMSIDLIAPALPAIANGLHVSHSTVKNLITLYLLGYATGNLLMGFLSDAIGRQKLFLGGWLLFCLVSILPVIYPNIEVLNIVRLLQGISLASIGSISRAIFSDILSPEQVKLKTSWIATSWGIGPILGPVIGGYLQYYIGWQACFTFFSIYGLIGFLSFVFILPETHQKRQPLNIATIKANFTEILSHKIFVGLVIIMGTSYASLIVFNTLGPFLIQNILGKTPIYFGHVALWMGVAFLLGTVICRQLFNYFQNKQILIYSCIGTLFTALIMLLLSCFFPNSLNVITIPSFFIFLFSGFVFPAAMGLIMLLFRHIAGSTAALMQFCNVIITSIVSFIMSLLTAHSSLIIAACYFSLLVISLACYALLLREK